MPASSSEPLIADASVVVKWLVEEVDSDRALVLEGRVLHAPTVVLAECANAIWAKLRRGYITRGDAEACLDTSEVAPLLLTNDAALYRDAFRLAVEIGRPIYDCLYRALAVRLDGRVLTADRRLLQRVQAHTHLVQRIRPLAEIH